jgi:hypothetical protein
MPDTQKPITTPAHVLTAIDTALHMVAIHEEGFDEAALVACQLAIVAGAPATVSYTLEAVSLVCKTREGFGDAYGPRILLELAREKAVQWQQDDGGDDA